MSMSNNCRALQYDTWDLKNILRLNANFPGFYNSMSKKPTITALFEV